MDHQRGLNDSAIPVYPKTIHVNANFVNNKYVYVKQQLIKENNNQKVLINPEFVRNVHINPHFGKLQPKKQQVHVNPLVFNKNHVAISKPIENVAKVSSPQVSTSSNLIETKPEDKDNTNDGCHQFRNKFKLVNVSQKIYTKYKIRRNTEVKKKRNCTYNIDEQKVKNRFCVDNRTTTKHKKLISRKDNLKYVSINGVLYRKSLRSLIATKGNTSKNNNVKRKVVNPTASTRNTKKNVLTIGGQKYQLNSNKKTLTLVSEKNLQKPQRKTISIRGRIFVQKNPNVYVKTNKVLSQSKTAQMATNKMKKSNIPCPMYRKFGRCKGKESGTCIRSHDPNQIALCTKFLQGACLNEKCLLSHRVSSEKMATCKFFLEGMCVKESCPYLHVKINAKADICKDFLEGFCQKGIECDKRHQYLCPSFEKDGKCSRKRCPYPHGNLVRKNKLAGSKNKFKQVENIDSDQNCDKLSNVRYYNEASGSKLQNSNQANSDSDKKETDSIRTRPQLGTLPSFIPFFNSE